MDEELDELAFRFFKLFAQYESTLKERGFFRSNKKGQIFVEWDRFAKEVVGPECLADLGNKRAAAIFILDAPQKTKQA